MVFLRLIPAAAAALAIAAATASCTGDIDIPDEGTEVLVVNLLAMPDSAVRASVTHSWPHSRFPVGDVTVADATVTLTVNGIPAGAMTFDPARRVYTLTGVTPSEGDRIEVIASSPRYGSAAGATTVPRRVKVDRWSFTPVEETDHNGIVDDGDQISYRRVLRIRYSITFTDPAGEDNYYLVSGRLWYEFGGGSCSDPILTENETPLDAVFSSDRSFVVFSDRSIRGRTYTLGYTCTYDPYIPLTELGRRITDRIVFTSISRDYYLYLLSIYKKYGDLNLNLEDMGLSEPRVIYSNVSPGAGVVAAQSTDTIVNDVHELVCRWIGIDPDQALNPGRPHPGEPE